MMNQPILRCLIFNAEPRAADYRGFYLEPSVFPAEGDPAQLPIYAEVRPIVFRVLLVNFVDQTIVVTTLDVTGKASEHTITKSYLVNLKLKKPKETTGYFEEDGGIFFITAALQYSALEVWLHKVGAWCKDHHIAFWT